MANRQFDVTATDFDMNDVVGTDAGDVTNDVRIVIREGLERDKAVIAIKAIGNLIAGNQVEIN